MQRISWCTADRWDQLTFAGAGLTVGEDRRVEAVHHILLCFRSVTSVHTNIECAQVCVQVAAVRRQRQEAHLNRLMRDVVVHDRLLCFRTEHLPCDSSQSRKRRDVTTIFSK